MRNLKLIFLMGSILMVAALVSCKPAAFPAPRLPSPQPRLVSPLPALVSPLQIVPEATQELPLSPVATPVLAATPSPLAAAGSGIRLTATLGPTCPGPQRPGQVCTKPYVGLFIVQTEAGQVVTEVTTDAKGQATIDLPPGQYTLTPKTNGPMMKGAIVHVTVPSGQVVDVSADVDTGMR